MEARLEAAPACRRAASPGKHCDARAADRLALVRGKRRVELRPDTARSANDRRTVP
jgi:hypothetical protein